MTVTNRRFVLASRPTAAPREDNFRLETAPIPELGAGQVLVRHHYLSLDPYMRGRMSDQKSYAAPQPLGEVMIGGTVGEVVATRSAGFVVGDKVVGMGGWQEYAIVGGDGAGLRKVDTAHVPLQAYLGAVGMPGVTAWVGLNAICEPKEGETVVVSAASGAVGGIVGQLAKAKGCRAVGVAGGKDKCDYVVGELGFDACVDYKAAAGPEAFFAMLRGATPSGIDCYFENVGGMILDAVMLQMNAFGRIAMCGMIAGYDGQPLPLQHPALILRSRLKVQGFIVSEHPQHWPRALSELGAGVATGKLKYRESIASGLDSAPGAFIGLLQGKNFGKQLVKLI
ncbi:MAG TPA: NADP-dependent oxidoreductase [Kofleriaceae bacterium]|jgi:NADPH-dependent curcumin reductase CurA|nr:NADP-dependent oxidoreductase [Kofleriaceae bacterium]